jgi:hypothetical protein
MTPDKFGRIDRQHIDAACVGDIGQATRVVGLKAPMPSGYDSS